MDDPPPKPRARRNFSVRFAPDDSPDTSPSSSSSDGFIPSVPLQPIPSEQTLHLEPDTELKPATTTIVDDDALTPQFAPRRLPSGRTRHLSLTRPRSRSTTSTASGPRRKRGYSLATPIPPSSTTSSPSTTTRRRRAVSEPPLPSLLVRLQSYSIDEATGRRRRPTVSAAGAALFDGITDPSVQPGIMAGLMSSVAAIPTPQQVHRRRHRRELAKESLESFEHSAEKQTIVLRHLVVEYTKLGIAFVCTWKGAAITLYLCLVVAFGGMLFLILVGAAPAMNHPDGPNGTDNAGKRWIEIDSQVLNGLFCLTGFGLMPQRTKHLYYLVAGQLGRPTTIQLVRRYPWYEPTRNWYALAAVLYLYELNSCFQIVMAAGMWAFNRHTRPAWLTGLSMGLGFASSIVAGILAGIENRKFKAEAEHDLESAHGSAATSANDLAATQPQDPLLSEPHEQSSPKPDTEQLPIALAVPDIVPALDPVLIDVEPADADCPKSVSLVHAREFASSTKVA
ncbi:uncharacterized protein V1518DRAFT_418451 [Limtongia smithiae]|uniref:uncharacterized protein n=1 Tax=Limtongia smithiae TaxID=1125753 RepID=UPI0034CD8353